MKFELESPKKKLLEERSFERVLNALDFVWKAIET